MGSCYGTPSLQQQQQSQQQHGVREQGQQVRVQEFGPLVLWQFPDFCKPLTTGSSGNGAGAEASSSSTATPAIPPAGAGAASGAGGSEQATGAAQQRRNCASSTGDGLLSGSGGPSLAASPPTGVGGPSRASPGANNAALRNHAAMSFAAVRGVTPELVRLQYREITPEDYEILSLLDAAVPKNGVTPSSTVSRLPCLSARDCFVSKCHVCLCELSPQTRVVRLPCSHSFHPECISRWLTQCNGKCPLCLQPIEGVAEDAKPNLLTDCGFLRACREAKGSLDANTRNAPSQSPSERESSCDRISSSTSQVNCDNLSTTAEADAPITITQA